MNADHYRLQTLKRGRVMELHHAPPACGFKCWCMANGKTPLVDKCCCPAKGGDEKSAAFERSVGDDGAPEEFDDDDFDLGPPPPSGPVLVRQNAYDAVAAGACGKDAISKLAMETTSRRKTVTNTAHPRGAAMMMAAPALTRCRGLGP